MKGVLLGPQQTKVTLGDAVAALGDEPRFAQGPVAVVTAGWQEREASDEELAGQLGRPTVNLNLYQRGEDVFAADPEFATLHRDRQDQLRQIQEYYRIRLAHCIDAMLDISRLSAGSKLEVDELAHSIEEVRELDQVHLKRCTTLWQEFEQRVKPLERPAIARHRVQLQKVLKDVGIVAIAGGHVAVLLNRLRLFGLTELLTDQALIAWSGGAMVTGERVVLFHESPPEGPGVAEVLEAGLGLHRGVLPLPNPKLRLKLDDPVRVSWFARRNAPEKCVALDQGDWVMFDGPVWSRPHGTQWLKPDGRCSHEWVGGQLEMDSGGFGS